MKVESKKKNNASTPTGVETWHVLICGLPLDEDTYDLGESLTLERLKQPLTIFDLAGVGAAGFQEWAVLQPLAHFATCEIISPVKKDSDNGEDALYKAWLVSALLILSGFTKQLSPACCIYSWNNIAGGANRQNLPKFQGGLLDFHLKYIVPKYNKVDRFTSLDAKWIAEHLTRFNRLTSTNEKFSFALTACIDWRFAADGRAAIARIWGGIEALLGISTELNYRISLFAAVLIAPRGPERYEAFKKVKSAYGIRSKAVHGAKMSHDQIENGINDAFDILKKMLLTCIDQSNVPSEDFFYEELLE